MELKDNNRIVRDLVSDTRFSNVNVVNLIHNTRKAIAKLSDSLTHPSLLDSCQSKSVRRNLRIIEEDLQQVAEPAEDFATFSHHLGDGRLLLEASPQEEDKNEDNAIVVRTHDHVSFPVASTHAENMNASDAIVTGPLVFKNFYPSINPRLTDFPAPLNLRPRNFFPSRPLVLETIMSIGSQPLEPSVSTNSPVLDTVLAGDRSSLETVTSTNSRILETIDTTKNIQRQAFRTESTQSASESPRTHPTAHPENTLARELMKRFIPIPHACHRFGVALCATVAQITCLDIPDAGTREHVHNQLEALRVEYGEFRDRSGLVLPDPWAVSSAVSEVEEPEERLRWETASHAEELEMPLLTEEDLCRSFDGLSLSDVERPEGDGEPEVIHAEELLLVEDVQSGSFVPYLRNVR